MKITQKYFLKNIAEKLKCFDSFNKKFDSLNEIITKSTTNMEYMMIELIDFGHSQ